MESQQWLKIRYGYTQDVNKTYLQEKISLVSETGALDGTKSYSDR